MRVGLRHRRPPSGVGLAERRDERLPENREDEKQIDRNNRQMPICAETLTL